VFTRPWVVNDMLNQAGYAPDRDLTRERVLESSIGPGAFALPVLDRLIVSKLAHHPDAPWIELLDCIRGFDVQADHVQSVRKGAVVALTDAGCPQSVADVLAATWFQAADFLLTDLGGWTATLVVGNPPYIRIEDVPAELLESYRLACPEMTGRADVYVGFIAKGLDALAEGGRLAFICADRWMHNAYGKALRAKVVAGFAVESDLKLHGVDAFEGEVDAYPAITMFRRGKQGPVVVGEAGPGFGERHARLFRLFAASPATAMTTPEFTASKLPGWHTTDAMWAVGSDDVTGWVADLDARHVPLERGDGRTLIRIGVATGKDAVFVVGPKNVPKIEPDRLLPLATNKDVKTGQFVWGGRYLVNPYERDGSLIELAKYPKTARYLRRYKALLTARHIVRNIKDKVKRAKVWHKTIDGVHVDRGLRPYLALEDLKAYAHPVLVPAGHYPHHGLYAITSDEWDLNVLGGLLISEVFERQVAAYCVRMRGKTLRFQAQYLRMCRVPDPESLPAELAAELAAAFTARDRGRATAAAMRAYGVASIPA
jgi:adenine-specific DNA-methyltransferase